MYFKEQLRKAETIFKKLDKYKGDWNKQINQQIDTDAWDMCENKYQKS